MKLLDACLALALTLAVFASAVTVLVEILHQSLRQRSRDLRGMLGAVFDGALTDRLGSKKADEKRLRQDFVDTLSTDKVLDDLVRNHAGALKFFRGRIATVPAVTIEDAMHRLPRSAVFKECLAQLTQEELHQVLQEVMDCYGRFERAISDFFRARARVLSFLMGIFLATAVNVDAVRLFNRFAQDPELTQQTIAKLESSLKEAEKTPSATGQVSQKTGNSAQSAQEDIHNALAQLNASQAVGLPIGWQYYPFCVAPDGKTQIDPICQREKPRQAATGAGQKPSGQGAESSSARDVWHEPLAWLYENGQTPFWVLCVVVTGLLIGLGGPYWFDLATSISRFRDLLKDGAPAKAEEKPAAPPDPAQLAKKLLAQAKGCAGQTANAGGTV